MMWRLVCAGVLAAGVCGSETAFARQGVGGATTQAAPVSGQTSRNTSAILEPGLSAVRQTLGNARLDKWKAPGPVRDAVAANMASIRRDMEGTLPPLLTDADVTPDSVARMLPVFRNVGALYDVLLRVVETGRLAAPAAEADALEAAMAKLDEGRRALGDRMQGVAVAADKQVADLRAAAKAQAARAVAVPAPDSAVVPAAKKKRKGH